MNKIVKDFYTNPQARPQSTSPHPPNTNQHYPVSLPGAPDKFTLETKAPKIKPWLHKAMLDPQTFQECLETLPNGKAHCPTGVPNDILKLAPPTLHHASTSSLAACGPPATHQTNGKKTTQFYSTKTRGTQQHNRPPHVQAHSPH